MIYYKQYGPIDSQKSKSFNFESKDIKRDNPSILNAKIQKPRKFKELKARASDFFKKHKKITIIFGLLIIVLFIIGLIILLNQPSQKDSSKNTKSWSEELTVLSQQLEELKFENKGDSLDRANNLILPSPQVDLTGALAAPLLVQIVQK